MDARTPHSATLDRVRAGGRTAATGSRWCCRAAGRSAPTRSVSTRRCTKRASSRIGCAACRSAPSIRRSSRAIRRERRLERLQIFWERITARKVWHYTPDGDIYRKARNLASTFMTTTLGQPGFFKPHDVSPWFSPAGAMTATSYYDTSPLRETLLELVDFDLINSRKVHFAVGAVNVLSGNFLYFDNKNENDRPRTRDGKRRAAAGAADGQDRHRSFLGWRHRFQHPAAASAGPGRQAEFAGVSGRPVQRPRHLAPRYPGGAGKAQGHRLLVPHPAQYRLSTSR